MRQCADCDKWMTPDASQCPWCGAPARREVGAAIASARAADAHPRRERTPNPSSLAPGAETHANRSGASTGRNPSHPLDARSRARTRGQAVRLVTTVTSLVLFGTFSALAIPGLRTMSANHRAAGEVNRLVASLHGARILAAEDKAVVRLCPRTGAIVPGDDVDARASKAPGLGTPPACADASADWHHGWIIYVDGDRDGRLSPGARTCPPTGVRGETRDCLVSVEAPLPGGNTLRGSSTLLGGLAYLPNGRGRPRGRFTLCDPDHGLVPRTVSISATGRVGSPAQDAGAPCSG